MSGWNDYGFPDPCLMPAYLPYVGMVKALNERARCVDVQEMDIPEVFSPCGTYGYAELVKFDRSLSYVSQYYVNQHKLEHVSDAEDFDGLMWTFDDLLLAAADGREEDVIVPCCDMSPQWDLRWLLQRQKAIQLLKYARLPMECQFVMGSVHTGFPSSAVDAADQAFERGAKQKRTDDSLGRSNSIVGTHVELIYGPDHGWGEGSYCCNIVVTEAIRAIFPEGMEKHDNARLLLNAVPCRGSERVPDGRVHAGINEFLFDDAGYLELESDFDYRRYVGTPTKDRQISFGWQPTAAIAFADFSESFLFK